MTVVSFLCCILFFCGYVFSNFSDSPDIIPRTVELRIIGLGFLLFSMIIGFSVIIAAEYQSDFDYLKLELAGVNRLARRLTEELEDQNDIL